MGSGGQRIELDPGREDHLSPRGRAAHRHRPPRPRHRGLEIHQGAKGRVARVASAARRVVGEGQGKAARSGNALVKLLALEKLFTPPVVALTGRPPGAGCDEFAGHVAQELNPSPTPAVGAVGRGSRRTQPALFVLRQTQRRERIGIALQHARGEGRVVLHAKDDVLELANPHAPTPPAPRALIRVRPRSIRASRSRFGAIAGAGLRSHSYTSARRWVAR